MFARRKHVPLAPRPMRVMEIRDKRLAPATREIPGPAPGEVQIRVAFAGINRAEVLQVEGSYLPPEGASDIPGLEISGTIAALGESTVGWSVGEEVCALLSGGGYAEYVNVPASLILAVPRPVELEASASLPEGCATAYMALAQLARLKPHERVLVHGGASGTGILIAQVAHAWGSEVLATVGSEEKAQALYEHGIRPINHTAGTWPELVMQATSGEGVHVVVDILGAPQLTNHFKLLKKGGRLVSLAFMEGNIANELKISAILTKNLSWSGAMLRGKSLLEKTEIIRGVRKTIWPYLATGAIRPVVDSVFPMEEAEKAHKRMQERLHIGKILLEMPANPADGR